MKTKFLLFFAIVMLLAFSSKAQIGVGETKNFTATNGVAANTNLWSVNDATAAEIATPDGVSTGITWKKPGSYIVTYTETNPNSLTCIVTKTLAVTVVGNTLSMGIAPPSDCAPTSGDSQMTFKVNRTGGVNAITVNYEYKINGGALTTNSVTISASAASADIVLTIPNPTNGTTDNVVALTITSATDANGNSIVVTGLTQSVTLFATPIITDIQYN